MKHTDPSNWLERVARFGRQLESALTNFLASLGPWLAPIPSAALVGRATVNHLGWEPWLGLVTGAIVEVLGLTATSTALALWDYNTSKRKDDPRAPFTLSALLVGVYVVVTVVLTVVMEIVPGLVTLAPALFPLMALVGTVNLALRSQHHHRLEAVAERKAERQAQRQGRRQEASPDLSKDVSNIRYLTSRTDALQAGRRAAHDARLEKLLDALRSDPAAGATQLADLVGVSRQTVYTYLDELSDSGRIHCNGNGIEVRDGGA